MIIIIIIINGSVAINTYCQLNCLWLLVLFGSQDETPGVLASSCDLGDRKQGKAQILLYCIKLQPSGTGPG